MRKVLVCVLAALFVLPLAVFASGGKETTSTTGGGAATAAGPSKYKEAPMLAELVKQGKLPPVEQRLPEKPLVYTQEWNEIPSADMKLEIGKYGGSIRLADPATEGGASPENWCFQKEPVLTAPGINIGDAMKKGLVKGGIFEGYEANQELTTFTFRLRKGLKWSDGVPVTMDDVKFTMEDIYGNKEVTPTMPVWLKPNQNPKKDPGVFTVVDDWNFRITFSEPYPLFIYYLTSHWSDYLLFFNPKHFLQQFHIKYSSLDKIKTFYKDQGLAADAEWFRLFAAKRTWTGQMGGAATGQPSLQPWVYAGQPAQGVFVFERNPYYFKVDASGQQLPYIDRIEEHFVTDLKGQTMKIIAGEVDYAVNRTNLSDYPLFKENEAKGGYYVVNLRQHVTPTDIFLNLTHPDPVWRQVVRNVKFRQALNYGIDRRKIMEIVQVGQGGLPVKAGTPTEFNPTRAKQLLDEIGLNKKDSEGWRLGPDGKRFIIPFEIAIYTVGSDKVVELVSQFWQDLGIYTTMKVIDMGLAGQRRTANDLKAETLWLSWTTAWDNDPSAWYVTLQGELLDYWAPAWRTWYNSNGAQGEEPPADVKELIKQCEIVVSAKDEATRGKAIAAAMDMFAKNVYAFPITESDYPMVYNQKMGNIPVKTTYGIAAAYSAEQFYYK